MIKYESGLEVVLQRFSWAKIAGFGNTYIAKAALLAPLIGQAVYFSGSFLHTHFGFVNVGALYWSLIYLAIGQIIFITCCPRTIKKYAGDIEKYKIESVSTMTTRRLDVLWLSQLRSNYECAGGRWSCPEYDKDKLIRTTEMVLDHHSIKWEVAFGTATREEIYEAYLAFQGRVSGKNILIADINWTLVRLLQYFVPMAIIGQEKVPEPDYSILRELLIERDDGSWKYASLDRKYNNLNLQGEMARSYVVLFYLCGSIYFIFNFLLNAWRMTIFNLDYFTYA